MAEKTRTTPAETNQVIMVGESISSSGVEFGFERARIFFACLSLLDSRDFRFDTTLGDWEGDL